MNYLGSLPFGMNANMSVDTAKQGMYGQNAMVAPNTYGGDPYSVMGGGNLAVSGSGPMGVQAFRQSMLPFLPQQPANPYQGMTPFGNHYTRYLMQGGQRLNRLARPARGDRFFGGDMSGKFGQQAMYQPAMPSPYASVE